MLQRIAVLEAEKAQIETDIKELKGGLLEYVEAAGDYEDADWKVTRVQGFNRKWNPDKLAKIVGKAMFIKLVEYVPDPEKIDEMVRAGKLDAKKIAPAFIETPKAAYPKITPKAKKDTSDADKLREALA